MMAGQAWDKSKCWSQKMYKKCDSAAVCRLCLAVEVRLFTITGSLQQVYERISGNDLYTTDGRPVVACYICYAQLNKCLRLMLTSARAENVLNAIVYSNSLITIQSVSAMDRQANGLCWPLTLSKTELFGSAPAAPEDKTDIESASTNVDVEDVAADVSDSDCDDEYDPITLVQPCETETDIKDEEEIDITEGDVSEGKIVSNLQVTDFPQPMRVTVSIVKDEDSGSDADDNSPVNSLRAETPVQGELREDGASAHTAEKQEQAEENETNRNQGKTEECTTEQSGLQCNVCQLSFKYQSLLKLHLIKHTQGTPHECHTCHTRFKYPSSLKTHLKTHNHHNRVNKKITSRNTEKPYTCNICNKCFTRQIYLKKHFRTHTGDKRFECNICQLKFYRKSNLTNHSRVHSGEKLFHCQVCDHKFTEKSALNKHLKIHNAEKPFECSVCQRRFNQKWNLDLHSRTHTDEKPYQCNVCGLKFRQSTYLKFHLRTHTGEKPYKCDVCQRGFSRSHHFAGHLCRRGGEKRSRGIVDKISFEPHSEIQAVDKVKEDRLISESSSNLEVTERQDAGVGPYKCDICQSRFKLKVAFRRHVINSHW